ncbi:MAG: hypothetical protein CME63_07025 [Halobacteriovoraceae bacterium]|nr:hypothetical protein [Halobacteriovoraceae bacterium]
MKKFSISLLIYSLLTVPTWAQKASTQASKGEYNIRELALPSEVDNLGKKAGSIFYSPSVKGKVLIPVHMWGEIKNSGLHFVPLDTSLINGLSLAGGPTSNSNLESVVVTTTREGKREKLQFDVSEGGDLALEDFKLKPGDTIFVEKDTFRQDRAYYTSLFGVALTVLSSILLYRQVKD